MRTRRVLFILGAILGIGVGILFIVYSIQHPYADGIQVITENQWTIPVLAAALVLMLISGSRLE